MESRKKMSGFVTKIQSLVSLCLLKLISNQLISSETLDQVVFDLKDLVIDLVSFRVSKLFKDGVANKKCNFLDCEPVLRLGAEIETHNYRTYIDDIYSENRIIARHVYPPNGSTTVFAYKEQIINNVQLLIIYETHGKISFKISIFLYNSDSDSALWVATFKSNLYFAGAVTCISEQSFEAPTLTGFRKPPRIVTRQEFSL